jgi:hypothetical protein
MDASALDIAISALENEVSRLELSIDGLEKWLWISSAAVALGVALEVAFLIHEYREDRNIWRRGIISPPSRPSLRVLSFEIASVLLVVAGIVGELWVGVISANRNIGLRSKNTKLIGLVREKAGNADERATTASSDAAKASNHEEKLEARTEREIDARLKLEKDLLWEGPRYRLLYSERALFNEHLKRFAGQRFKVSVCILERGMSPGNEVDLTALAMRLLLAGAGWVPSGWPGLPPFDLMIPDCSGAPGISVGFLEGAPEETRAAAVELRSTIKTVLKQNPYVSGIVNSWGIAKSNGAFPKDEIEVHVGVHPILRGDPLMAVAEP